MVIEGKWNYTIFQNKPWSGPWIWIQWKNKTSFLLNGVNEKELHIGNVWNKI